MRKYTIILIWDIDLGMAGSTEERREFTITSTPDDVEERAELLMGHHGAFDYEIVEL